jgi:hypothetical protein
MPEFGRDQLGLPDLGFLDEFVADAEQSRSRALAQLPADGTRPPPRSSFSGEDRAQIVVVTVDPAGMVRDVDLHRDWRQTVSAESLPAAIFDAYTAALKASLEAVALTRLWEAEQQRKAGEPTVVERRPDVDLPPTDEHEWLAWVRRSLLELNDEVHRIDLLGRSVSKDRTRTLTGAYGLFQVTVQGQIVTAVRADPTRIGAADLAHLRQDALDALRSAGHRHADS